MLKAWHDVMLLILIANGPFSLPGTLLARAVHFSHRNCTGVYGTILVAKIVVVVPFISARKKKGGEGGN